MLGRIEDPKWRDNIGGFLRVASGGAVAVAVLLVTGLGWHAVNTPPMLALAEGVALGLATIAVCMGT